MTDDRDKLQQEAIANIINEALAPLQWMLTTRGDAVFREHLQDMIATHPVMVELLEQIVPPVALDNSGTVEKGGDFDDEQDEASDESSNKVG